MVARQIRIGPPSYVGPGDIVSGAVVWWGLRAYSSAAIGTNCVKLRRDSDNATQDFVTLDDGSLDVASIATFKGAAGLFIHTIYDQSGNGRNAVQTTNADQLVFTLSGLGSLPIATDSGGGAGGHAVTSATVTIAQPMTVSAVALFDGVAGRWTYTGDSGANTYFGHRGTQAILYAGAEVGPTVSNGWHSVQSVVNGASSDNYVDGVSSTGNGGALTISSATLRFGNDSTAIWNSSLVEIGYWGSDFGASKSAMDSNQQTYWGI